MRMRCVLLVMMLAVSGVFAVEQPSFFEAIPLVNTGEYDAAVELLLPQQRKHPGEPLLYYWLGRAYYGQRRYRQAASALEQAATRDPLDPEIGLWCARALRAGHKHREALDTYAEYSRRFPDDTMLLSEYAATRALTGDYPGARECFARLAVIDPAPDTKSFVAEWERILTGLDARTQLEPSHRLQARHFEFCYAPHDGQALQVYESVENARREIGDTFGVELTGFRVLLFAEWDAYARYARIFLPHSADLCSTAFTLSDLLVFWSPSQWARDTEKQAEFASTLRHELVHLAIARRSHVEGVPTWLNEGLACYYGGWGGIETGALPKQPLSLSELDAAFHRETDNQAHAYAQAHAMAIALVEQLGQPGVLKLIDQLAAGAPLPRAFQHVSGESFDAFLAIWPGRYQAVMQAKAVTTEQ